MTSTRDKTTDLQKVAARLSGATQHLTAALSCVSVAMAGLRMAPFEAPVKGPSNTPSTREEIPAAHRRAHRSGRPGKIEGDPELQAFILARIDNQTFTQILSEVRATFPPDRHCSHSGLGRWWQKRKPG